MSSPSTADWHLLFDRYYRRSDLYDLPWSNVFLGVHKLVGAPFGGPLAVYRDPRAVGGASDTGSDTIGGRPKIRLFTCSGDELAAFQHDATTPIVGVNWTAKEQLVVVCEDGSVVLYSVHGERLSSFAALPESAKSNGVAEVDFWPEGMVIRTGLKSELWAIMSWSNPRPIRLAQPALEGKPPISMIVSGNANGCEVMLATVNGSIICVDQSQAQDQLLTSGPFARMSLSPSGSLLAAFNDDGTLHLMSTDFKSCLSKFATGSKLPPQQLMWCGEDGVVLAWPGMILLVGLLGDFVKFSMESAAYTLVPEFDGVRIITNDRCSWLSAVNTATESVFKVGSNTVAARLFDAFEAYEAGEARADDALRELSQDQAGMKQAIEQCLHAAVHEYDYEVQRSLLKAASYGKLVCSVYKSDKFVDQCRVLRVLNAVRAPHIGMPLTAQQYTRLEGELLVDRLVARHQHFLAMRICEYLRIHPERVLVHWSCAKIKHEENMTDEVLGAIIVKKLSLCPGISYANIASTAFRHGRRALATLLLEYEPLASDQVPLLMSMKEDELALTKAIQSGDTDLVYLALLHLKKHRKQKDFFQLIKDKPLARDLYITYCKQADLPSLKSFYYYLQQPQAAADITVLEAYKCEDYKDRLAGFELALEFYEKDKTQPFAARAIEEEIQLLKLEREQEVTQAESGLIDLSVTQLMERYIAAGDSKRAAKLKSVMKVSDKRQWYIEVATLARHGFWEELGKLVANKKIPPIGFQPFIDACITYKNLPEAAKYIARLPDYQDQMEWLCNIGYWNEAVDIAGREKDIDALMLLRERCARQPMVSSKIEKLLQLLSGGK